MYYVYLITFDNFFYVGCTNNLRRRKDQHNENARNKKSKLGIFLNENSIVLKTSDLRVLFNYDDRSKALRKERKLALDMDNQGHNLLNDNYTHTCSRKGKNIGNTAKTYYVIDFIEHSEIKVNDLRQYCIKCNLDYKLMQRTAKGNHYYNNRYKVFHESDWENEVCKEKYLSGEFVKEAKQNQKRFVKEYVVLLPNREKEKVINLDKFAREHHLSSGTLHATYIKGKPTKGYQVIRRM